MTYNFFLAALHGLQLGEPGPLFVGTPGFFLVLRTILHLQALRWSRSLPLGTGSHKFHPSLSSDVLLTLIVGVVTACFPTACRDWGTSTYCISDTIWDTSLSSFHLLQGCATCLLPCVSTPLAAGHTRQQLSAWGLENYINHLKSVWNPLP